MERDGLEQVAERAGERLEERVEHEQLARERAGPLLVLLRAQTRKEVVPSALVLTKGEREKKEEGRREEVRERRTLNCSGTMLNTLMTSNMHLFSSSSPKCGPPLQLLPLHKSPCSTPARVSSSARKSGSWNLSLIRADLIPACSAWASGPCRWFGCKNLFPKRENM